MRTKEEIAAILAKRKLLSNFKESSWTDLVAVVQGLDDAQKSKLVFMLVNGQSKRAGSLLRDALYAAANTKSVSEVDAMLSDDSLDLSEIDSLL